MKNKLDKLFNDQLTKHEEAPPSHAWDKIHSQLAKNKRILWSKKLGIAATILIFISIGYFGYHKLDIQSKLNNEIVAESFEVTKELEKQSVVEIEQEESKKMNYQGIKDGKIIESRSNDSNENTKINKADSNFKNESQRNYDIDNTLINVSQLPEKEIEVINENLIVNEEIPTETFLTRSTEMENTKDDLVIIKPEKTYASVKIIYKANKNSKLVEAKKSSYVDRGVNKINQFSEKHLLTEDRKTMLRNTKEDLLALNLGKLFKN